jgi:uncharacterized protein (UPF0333 family)
MSKSITRRGQGSLEYVVLLSFTIVFFIIIVSVATDQLSIVGKQQRKQQAQLALKQIADAATDVYQQGSGAKSTISVIFPSGVDPGSGYIIDKSLHISFEGSDITYLLGFNITGVLPSSPGAYTMQFISQGGSVSLGLTPFTIDPPYLSFVFCAQPYAQNSSQTLIYSNNQNISTPIQITTDWANDSATMSYSPSSFDISFGGNQSVEINVTASANITGTFSGVLFSNTTNYTATTIITVSVENCGGGVTPTVAQAIVRTYSDSTYTVLKSAFNPVENVTLTGTQWVPSSTVTFDITNSSGSSVPGYPKEVSTNPSGTFTEVFDTSGLPSGTYTANATEEGVSKTFTFTLRGCT